MDRCTFDLSIICGFRSSKNECHFASECIYKKADLIPVAVKPRHFEQDDIEYIAAADGFVWCSNEQGEIILKIGRD